MSAALKHKAVVIPYNPHKKIVSMFFSLPLFAAKNQQGALLHSNHQTAVWIETCNTWVDETLSAPLAEATALAAPGKRVLLNGKHLYPLTYPSRLQHAGSISIRLQLL